MRTFKWTVPTFKHDEHENPLKDTVRWQCPKCDCDDFRVGEFHATGNAAAKLFDIQNERFSTITCNQCAYTEVYKCKKNQLQNALDLIIH